MMAKFPTVAERLPDFFEIVQELGENFMAGDYPGWPAFAAAVRERQTPEKVTEIDLQIPYWGKMCSYAEETTMIHVNAVFVASFSRVEYHQSAERYQELLHWTILLHDVAKVAGQGYRDSIHPFRSTVYAAKALGMNGFPLVNTDRQMYQDWIDLTYNAIIAKLGKPPIPDNRKLPGIIEGIEALFGEGTPASLILKAILLHQSFNVLNDWPQAAPLTPGETAKYVNKELFPLLVLIHLMDSDSWQLYDTEHRENYYSEIKRNLAQYQKYIKS